MELNTLSTLFKLDELLELRHQAHALGMASHHLINSSFSGLYASVFHGQGLDFEKVREYEVGDDIRNMDWKVTARTGKPHLKVFQEERERHVILCVDQGSHMHFATRGVLKSVQAAKACALLGWAALSQHDRVGGIVFAQNIEYFRPATSRRSLWRLLKYLTENQSYQRSSCIPLFKVLTDLSKGVNTGSLIFIMSDFNRELVDLRKHLIQLCQQHTVVLCSIDDPADIHLPDMGTLLFHDAMKRVIKVNTSDETGQRLYTEQWQNRRKQLKQLCIQLNIGLIEMKTNDEIHQALAKGLHACQHLGVIH